LIISDIDEPAFAPAHIFKSRGDKGSARAASLVRLPQTIGLVPKDKGA
jgi:hypothetical protein